MKKNIEYIKTRNANTSEDIRAEIKKFRDERLVKEEEEEQEQEQQQNQEQNNVIIFRYLSTLIISMTHFALNVRDTFLQVGRTSKKPFSTSSKNVEQSRFNALMDDSDDSNEDLNLSTSSARRRGRGRGRGKISKNSGDAKASKKGRMKIDERNVSIAKMLVSNRKSNTIK